ncbi:MAG: DUF4355 domain-containing protein [Christensenellales bacterium]|jgi:glutamate mutase epsilon subunit
MKMTNELKKWNLQLFADDPDDGGNPNPDGDPRPDDRKKDPDKKDPDGEKKYTDKDMDDIVNKKYAKWKAQYDKELEDAKKEAEKLAKMNADQKKDYEIEKMKAENAELREAAARVELGKEATNILKENKIDATQDILDFVVGADADSTKANIDKFVGIIEAQIKAAEVARATGRTPREYGGGGAVSREDIMKIADPIKRQEAIAENFELFE